MAETSNSHTFRQALFLAVIVALIAAVGTIVAAWIGKNNDGGVAPEPPDWKLGVEVHDGPDLPTKNQLTLNKNELFIDRIDASEQKVNQIHWPNDGQPEIEPALLQRLKTGIERATFRFVVQNPGNSQIAITKGEVLIDEVHTVDLRGAVFTTMITNLMDHTDHMPVFVSKPRLGDVIPVNVTENVAPDTSKEIILWVRSNDRHPLLVFDARLRLHFGERFITSKAFRVEIHTETNDFPNSDGIWTSVPD